MTIGTVMAMAMSRTIVPVFRELRNPTYNNNASKTEGKADTKHELVYKLVNAAPPPRYYSEKSKLLGIELYQVEKTIN